jgi:hypothetical protein
MGISVFPAAGGGASEALPLGATAKVASGYAATGGWKYNTSTAAGTYQLTVQAPQDQIYGIKTANGVQVGNITGNTTVPFKTTSTEASITIGSIYPFQKSVLTSIGSTLRQVNGGNGLFILISNDGYLYTSTDGLSWTNRTTGTEGTAPNCNIPGYVNDRWVVPGWSNGTTNANILHSTDGITWSQRSLSATMGSSRIDHIGYGDGYWYAFANNGTTTTNAARSADFSSWSTITLPTTAQPLSYLYYNNKGTNYHIIGGGGGAIFYSTNGTSWTAASAGSGDINKLITDGNNRLIAVGNTTATTSVLGFLYQLSQIAGGTEPTTWLSVQLATGITIPGNIIQGNYVLGMFMLLFSGVSTIETSSTAERNQIGSSKILLSRDGFTWTMREVPRIHTNTSGQLLDQVNGVICYPTNSGQTYFTTAYNSAAFHITSTALTSV